MFQESGSGAESRSSVCACLSAVSDQWADCSSPESSQKPDLMEHFGSILMHSKYSCCFCLLWEEKGNSFLEERSFSQSQFLARPLFNFKGVGKVSLEKPLLG